MSLISDKSAFTTTDSETHDSCDHRNTSQFQFVSRIVDEKVRRVHCTDDAVCVCVWEVNVLDARGEELLRKQAFAGVLVASQEREPVISDDTFEFADYKIPSQTIRAYVRECAREGRGSIEMRVVQSYQENAMFIVLS